LILLGAGSAWADARAEIRPQGGRTGAALAWLHGEVILDSTPLAEAVAEMNRYDRRRLVVVDPAIAAVRISGVYHTGNLELFAAMVARLYGFRVAHRGGRIHLLAPTPTLTAEK
jgi:transmembrane sensor